MSDELDTIVAADNDKYMIRCENLVKIYKTSDVEVVALQGLDLDVERGELMAIVGNSGSGKSTLLNMLGGLDKPSAGNLYVDGKDLLKFTDKDYMEYKRNTVGFVWQNNARNLVPYLTAVQNVELPMLLNGEHKRRQKALELLDRVGLLKRKNSRLDQMSGGEQQRVAIARAIAKNPKLLLCDEPTGALDYKTGKQILKLLQDTARKEKMTVLIITHNAAIAPMADKVIRFKNGTAESVEINENPLPVENIEW